MGCLSDLFSSPAQAYAEAQLAFRTFAKEGGTLTEPRVLLRGSRFECWSCKMPGLTYVLLANHFTGKSTDNKGPLPRAL